MNRDEVVQAQQQFIAEFTKLSKEEQLDFLRFNRYHHLRPINEVISIYIQNPEARILGSFDFWKDLTNESSVQFGQKASVRLWDSNGRIQEVLFDLAQTTLIDPFEIKSTLLSNRVLVNTLADIAGHDYLLGNRDEEEFLDSSTTFIKDYIERTVPNLSGYSDRQRSVALSIAQYNIFEEFGAYLDTGVGHEDFSNHILESFEQLNAEDNLLRTFSLANSFSRQLTKLINERYEQVSSLTDDLMLNQATLNESIDEITADVDFNVINNDIDKKESVALDNLSEIEQDSSNDFPSFNSEQIWAMKEIIPTFYPDFPSETTDEELVALAEQMRDSLASDSNLRESAKVNTYRDFESSLNDSIGAYLLEHHSDNKELFNFLLNHQPIDFPRVIGKQIYEYLHDTVALKIEEVSKSDTMLEEKDTQPERAPSTQEIIKNIEEYNQVIERGYSQLHDSYMHYQDLKLKGQNVSGAYDTFDFKTTQGAVQLGYNYIGREQGTNDDSQVVFWASTDVDAYSTDPMSTPIRSRVIRTFDEAGQALHFGNTSEKNNESVEELATEAKTQSKPVLDRVEFLTRLKEQLIPEKYWDKFPIGSLSEHPELTENDAVLTIYDLNGVPNAVASMDLEGHLDTYDGIDELIESQTGIKDFNSQLIVKAFVLRDEFAKEKGFPLPKEPYKITDLKNRSKSVEIPDVTPNISNSYLDNRALLEKIKKDFNLSEDYTIYENEWEIALQKVSFGGVLNEFVIKFEDGELNISDVADSITNIKNFTTEAEKIIEDFRSGPTEPKIPSNDEVIAKDVLEENIDQEQIIEEILLRSSDIKEGNFRIQHYFEEHSALEPGFKKYGSAFLAKEYGIGGYSSTELSYDYDSKGLKIKGPIELTLSWSNIAERISEFVQDSLYLTGNKIDDYQEWLLDEAIVNFAELRWPQIIEEKEKKEAAAENGEIDLFDFPDSIETDLENNPENTINEITQLSDEELQEQIIDSYGKMIGNEGNGYSRGSFNRWAELRQEEIRRNNLKEVKEISLFDDIEDVAFTEENQTDSTQIPQRTEDTSSFEETTFPHEKIPTDSQLYQAGEILSEMLDEIEQRKPQILFEWSGGLQRLKLDQMIEESREGLVSLDLQSGQFIPDETFLDKWTVEQKEMLRQRLSEVMEIPYEPRPQLELEPKFSNKPLIDFEFPNNSTDFYPRTPTEKVNANLAAIKLTKELKGQLATPEQQQILGKYVGWGGLADTIFDESNPRFENQRNELKALVSKDEYAEMRKSSLTAFYTDPKVIQTIYAQLQTLGFEGGRILDPSMGTGNFFAAMPGEMKQNSSLYGVEIDNITGEIAQQLHQKSDIQIKGFESTNFANDGLDLVITNVPFSEVIRLADEQYDNVYPIHDYFIKKSLDLVHEGGLVAIITSTGTMDKKDSRFREELSKNANLVSAVRLPNGTFKSIAGTDVSSDLLIFQKTSTPNPHPNWIKTELQKDGKGNQINVNHYFMENPQYLLGQIKIETFNRGMLSVVRDFEQEQLYDKISEAFSQQAEAAYYGEHEASVFEEALQIESDVPQEIIAQAEPYTLFIYKNKPYYFDGKSVTPHQKSSSVTLNRNETRKNQLSRYENNKSKIFETTPKFKEVFNTKGYLDTWNNFIVTESLNGVPLPEIPREILDRLANGEHEITDSDKRYHYVKGDLQNRLIIEEVISTQYRYKVDYSTKDVQAMRQMIEMRHTLQDLLNIQHLPDYDQGEYENLRLKLNAQYDKFVDKFGAISNQANSLLMRTDDYYEFLASIEEETEDELTKEPKIVKGTVFYEPTIQPQPTSLVVNNASDALLASLNHRGKLDFEYMESIYNHTKEEIIDELGDRLFYIGDGIYQTKEDYLSGDVKTKLLEARNNQAFQVEERNWFENIAALEEVVPKDLPLSDITYKFGSRFIPTSLYQDFLTEVMETKATVVYDKASDSYDVSLASHQRFAITNTYGHKGFDGQKLANVLLNQKPGKIYMPDPEDPYGNKRILDQVATAVLEEKSEALKERFKQWVEQNLEVQETIVDVYNEQFNRYVVKTYDGSGLTINGLAKQFQPRPHQNNAIMRTVQELRAGYAHEVGSGKTLTMLASNMKLQELGMVHNALFVIPKPLINQFAREIYKYFPESKVLVAQPEDFTKAGRKRFVSRIATGKYHAIIIADSQFGKIGMSKAYQENYIKEQLYEARSMIEQAEEGSYTVKKAEKTIEALKTRLEKLQKTDTDSFITFEELGIDMLYVDEAHGFKNLAPYTQLENVKGVSDTRAEKSMDLMMKIEYMHNLYDNRRVVFSTGTPMSNSVVELYTMMKYTEPDVLEKYGVANFDSWVSSFGIIENNFELTASGTFKVNRRFTKFGNVPELMNMFRETWDIQTQEMLDLPVPHAEMIAHETNVTGEQARYIESLIDRAKLIEAGVVEPKADNMLKIVGENRKLTLDMRALDDKRYSAFDSDKLTQVVDEVFRIYTENDDKKSTQMIFSDLSVPVKYRNSQPKNSDDSINMFSAYDEIKRMLVSKGVPESEVRFIHEATEKNKEAMMRDMRVGKIRVLIGSTSKAGTGLNVQDKMIAVHHLDVPWRPSDITQRNGRLIRQGNENPNVSVHYYITKGSMDAFLWQTQENKAKVISQIMSGQSDAREMEEIGDTQINMGKYKTIAEGNPLKQEYMQLEQKFQELERSRTRFFDSKITDLKRVKTAQEQLPRFEQRITAVQNDIKALEETKESPFNIDIYYNESTRHFDDNDKKTDVAEFLARQIQNHSLQSRVDKETTLIKIADYRGFEVLYVPKTERLTIIGESIDEKIILKNEAQYSLLVSPDKPLGIFSKIDNFFESGLTRDLLQTEEEVKRLNSSISGILKNQNMEFPKEEEYQHSKERLNDLRSELNPNPNVQEQEQEKTKELTR